MIQTTTATVENITPLTNSILQIVLKPNQYIDYKPGQYLQIILEDESLSYSIANAPLGSHHYELHVRHSNENPLNQTLLMHIKQSGQLELQLPLGDCHLGCLDPIKPILFVAGGTGFAPIKAMIEQLLAYHDPRHFELYWGARSQSDLYLDDKVTQWKNHVENFKYFSLLSTSNKESITAMIVDNHPKDLLNWQIVIAGPFEMVYGIRDQLIKQGFPRKQLYSDAFSFETKEDAS